MPHLLGRSDQVVLMEYIGDDDGPAPMIQHALMERDEAATALASLLRDIETMLTRDRIHGELSPFKVLY